jgi:hypothetical protein
LLYLSGGKHDSVRGCLPVISFLYKRPNAVLGSVRPFHSSSGLIGERDVDLGATLGSSGKVLTEA